MTENSLFRRRIVYGASLVAIGAYAALGPRINPWIAVGVPLRIDVLALAFLGLFSFSPGLPSAERVGGRNAGPRVLGLPLVVGGLLGAAFVAPWAAFPWLVVPALALAWSGRGRSRGWVGSGSGVLPALTAAVISCAVVVGASSRGFRISPEDFAKRDFRVNNLLADVPLHDAWAVDLKGHPSPTLEDLATAYRGGSPFQATPAVLGLGLLRGVAGFVLGWDDPQWSDVNASFVHRLSESDRRGSTTEPGTILGIWRVLYAFPREGVVETINGTAHVAVAATIGEGPTGPRLFLSFRVREVNWTTPFYMRLIDPARRYFVYPFLLRQFAHTWERGGWDQPEEILTGGLK